MDGGGRRPYDSVEITCIGTLYKGPIEKKFWSSSRGKDKYPFPVGYTATRWHGGHSYTMEVSEGPRGPLFKVTCEEGISCIGQTPSAPWEHILKKRHAGAKKVLFRSSGSSIDGPEMFGFTNPLVQRLFRDVVDLASGAAEQSNSSIDKAEKHEGEDALQSEIMIVNSHVSSEIKNELNSKIPTNFSKPSEQSSERPRQTGASKDKSSIYVQELEASMIHSQLGQFGNVSNMVSGSFIPTMNSPREYRHKFHPLNDILAKEEQIGISKNCGHSDDKLNEGEELLKQSPPTKRPRTARFRAGTPRVVEQMQSSPQLLKRSMEAPPKAFSVEHIHTPVKKLKVEDSVAEPRLKSSAGARPLPHKSLPSLQSRRRLISPKQGSDLSGQERQNRKENGQPKGSKNSSQDSLETVDEACLKSPWSKPMSGNFLTSKKGSKARGFKQLESDGDLVPGEGILSVDLMCPQTADVGNKVSQVSTCEGQCSEKDRVQVKGTAECTQQDGVFLLLEACKLAGDSVPTSPDVAPRSKFVPGSRKHPCPLDEALSPGSAQERSSLSRKSSPGHILNIKPTSIPICLPSGTSEFLYGNGRQEPDSTPKVGQGMAQYPVEPSCGLSRRRPVFLGKISSKVVFDKHQKASSRQFDNKVAFNSDESSHVTTPQAGKSLLDDVEDEVKLSLDPLLPLGSTSTGAGMSGFTCDDKCQSAQSGLQDTLAPKANSLNDLKMQQIFHAQFGLDMATADSSSYLTQHQLSGATLLNPCYQAKGHKDVHHGGPQPQVTLQLKSSKICGDFAGVDFLRPERTDDVSYHIGDGPSASISTSANKISDCLVSSRNGLGVPATATQTHMSRNLKEFDLNLDPMVTRSTATEGSESGEVATASAGLLVTPRSEIAAPNSSVQIEAPMKLTEMELMCKQTTPIFTVGPNSQSAQVTNTAAGISGPLQSEQLHSASFAQVHTSGNTSLAKQAGEPLIPILGDLQTCDFSNKSAQVLRPPRLEIATPASPIQLHTLSKMDLKGNWVIPLPVVADSSQPGQVGTTLREQCISPRSQISIPAIPIQAQVSTIVSGIDMDGKQNYPTSTAIEGSQFDQVATTKDKCPADSSNGTLNCSVTLLVSVDQVDLLAETLTQEDVMTEVCQDKFDRGTAVPLICLTESSPHKISEGRPSEETGSFGKGRGNHFINLGTINQVGCAPILPPRSKVDLQLDTVCKHDLITDAIISSYADSNINATSVSKHADEDDSQSIFERKGKEDDTHGLFPTHGNDVCIQDPYTNGLTRSISEHDQIPIDTSVCIKETLKVPCGLEGSPKSIPCTEKIYEEDVVDKLGRSNLIGIRLGSSLDQVEQLADVICSENQSMRQDASQLSFDICSTHSSGSQQYKDESDSMGVELTKSMMKLLLPQAVPFLQKGYYKSTKSVLYVEPQKAAFDNPGPGQNACHVHNNGDFHELTSVGDSDGDPPMKFEVCKHLSKCTDSPKEHHIVHQTTLMESNAVASDDAAASIKPGATLKAMVTLDNSQQNFPAMVSGGLGHDGNLRIKHETIDEDKKVANDSERERHSPDELIYSHLASDSVLKSTDSVENNLMENGLYHTITDLVDYEGLPSGSENFEALPLKPAAVIEHSIPVCAIILNVRGNEIRLCICCGNSEETQRKLFVYETHITDEDADTEPRLLGIVNTNMRGDGNGALNVKLDYEESGIRFTPNGQEIILLNFFQLATSKEKNEEDMMDGQDSVSIVSFEHSEESRINVQLPTEGSMRCLLVPKPDMLMAAGDSGSVNCWRMDQTWRTCEENFLLPSPIEGTAPFSVITRLLAVPEQPGIIVGCDFAGNISIWDSDTRVLISSFSVPNHHFYKACVVELSKLIREVYESDSALVKGEENDNDTDSAPVEEDKSSNATGSAPKEAQNSSNPSGSLLIEQANITEVLGSAVLGEDNHANAPESSLMEWNSMKMECLPVCLLVMTAAIKTGVDNVAGEIYNTLLKGVHGQEGRCKTLVLQDSGIYMGPASKESAAAASVTTIGHYGVMGTTNGCVLLWDILNGQQLSELCSFEDSPATCMVSCPASAVLAVGGGNGRVVLYLLKSSNEN